MKVIHLTQDQIEDIIAEWYDDQLENDENAFIIDLSFDIDDGVVCQIQEFSNS